MKKESGVIIITEQNHSFSSKYFHKNPNDGCK